MQRPWAKWEYGSVGSETLWYKTGRQSWRRDPRGWRAQELVWHAGMMDLILRSVEDFKQEFDMSWFSLLPHCKIKKKDRAAKINLHTRSAESANGRFDKTIEKLWNCTGQLASCLAGEETGYRFSLLWVGGWGVPWLHEDGLIPVQLLVTVYGYFWNASQDISH